VCQFRDFLEKECSTVIFAKNIKTLDATQHTLILAITNPTQNVDYAVEIFIDYSNYKYYVNRYITDLTLIDDIYIH